MDHLGKIPGHSEPAATITWRGSRTMFATDHEGHRLYVCERFGRFQAWVDDRKIGEFNSIAEAKAASVKTAEQP